MSRHPNKEIRAAVDYMIAGGWTVVKAGGHAWGRRFLSGRTGRVSSTDVDLVDAALAGIACEAFAAFGGRVSASA